MYVCACIQVCMYVYVYIIFFHLIFYKSMTDIYGTYCAGTFLLLYLLIFLFFVYEKIKYVLFSWEVFWSLTNIKTVSQFNI